MAEIIISRPFHLFGLFKRWSIYANGKKIGRIRFRKSRTYSLPAGTYTFQVKFNDLYWRICSNTMTVTLTDDTKPALYVRPHPLFNITKRPKWFKLTETLVLLDTNDHFAAHLHALDEEKAQVLKDIKKVKLHPASWVLVLFTSAFMVVTNIAYQNLFESQNGFAVYGAIRNIMALVGGPMRQSAITMAMNTVPIFTLVLGYYLLELVL